MVRHASFIICSALTSVGTTGYDHSLMFLSDPESKSLRGVMATDKYDERTVWNIWQEMSPTY